MGNSQASTLQTREHAILVFGFLDVGDVFRLLGVCRESRALLESKGWDIVRREVKTYRPYHTAHIPRLACCGFGRNKAFRPLAWWLALADGPALVKIDACYDIRVALMAGDYHAVRVASKIGNIAAVRFLVHNLLAIGANPVWKSKALIAALKGGQKAVIIIILAAIKSAPQPGPLWGYHYTCSCKALYNLPTDCTDVTSYLPEGEITRVLAKKILARISAPHPAIRNLIQISRLGGDQIQTMNNLIINACRNGDLESASRLLLLRGPLSSARNFYRDTRLNNQLYYMAAGGCILHPNIKRKPSIELAEWVFANLGCYELSSIFSHPITPLISCIVHTGRTDILHVFLTKFITTRGIMLAISQSLAQSDTNSPILLACRMGRTDILKELFKYLRVDSATIRKNKHLQRALGEAVRNGRFATLLFLRNIGCTEMLLEQALVVPCSKKVLGWIFSVIDSPEVLIRRSIDSIIISNDKCDLRSTLGNIGR